MCVKTYSVDQHTDCCHETVVCLTQPTWSCCFSGVMFGKMYNENKFKSRDRTTRIRCIIAVSARNAATRTCDNIRKLDITPSLS